MKRSFSVVFVSFIFVFLLSCTNDDSPLPVNPQVVEKPGVFVVNEGNFTMGNASLSYYKTDDNTLIQDLFYSVNGVPLGDVAEFMIIHDNIAYIVVNNSGVVYKVDVKTGVFLGKITGLVSPREILFLGGKKMLITDIVKDKIYLVNEESLTVESKIDLDGYTSESMIKVDNKIYVNNWSAMYQEKKNNQVLIIDVNTLKLIDSIHVAVEPNSMVLDKDKNLWVLCSGGYLNEETPALFKIDTGSDTIVEKLEFSRDSDYPTELTINGAGDIMYYINNDVYKLDISASSIPQAPFIASENRKLFSLGIDPVSSDIFISDALNYTQKGKIYLYNSEGVLKNSFIAGIIPGYFCFYN